MAIDAITGLFKTTRSIDPVEILKEYVQDILAVRAAHFPKPVLLVPGNLPALHAVPQILPLQILRIGSFALTGIPGEITAVAGMQLRETVRSRLAGNEGLVALGAYANGYAQYFTTAEEYAGQDYEGASNLYGPASLAALLSQYDSMSKEITNGQKTQNGVSAPDLTAFISGIATKRRMTVRNLSSMSVEFWVFGPNETNFKPGRELISLTVDRGGEVAVMLDGRLGLLDWDVQVILNRLIPTFIDADL